MLSSSQFRQQSFGDVNSEAGIQWLESEVRDVKPAPPRGDWWHFSSRANAVFDPESLDPIHVGTRQAAVERAGYGTGTLWRMDLRDTPVNTPDLPVSDAFANVVSGTPENAVDTEPRGYGETYDDHFDPRVHRGSWYYRNAMEDVGSISVVGESARSVKPVEQWDVEQSKVARVEDADQRVTNVFRATKPVRGVQLSRVQYVEPRLFPVEGPTTTDVQYHTKLYPRPVQVDRS